MTTTDKPPKKSDNSLKKLISWSLQNKNYLITHHAKSRQKERFISDLDILYVLKSNYTRIKRKDTYTGREDWNYCIEGVDLDGSKVRIILSFTEEMMLIITVIKLLDKPRL